MDEEAENVAGILKSAIEVCEEKTEEGNNGVPAAELVPSLTTDTELETGLDEKLGLDATQEIILQLLQIIRVAGLVEEVSPPREKDEVPGYQIPGSAIRWIAGDGSKPFHDPLRVPTESKGIA